MSGNGRSGNRARHRRRHTWLLAVLDAVVVAGFLGATYDPGSDPAAHVTKVLAGTALTIGTFYLFGLYRARITLSALDTLPQLVIAAWLLAPLAMAMHWDDDHTFIPQVLMCWVALLMLRVVYYAVVRHRRAAHPENGARTLVIGGGKVADELVRAMSHYPVYGLRPVLVMDDDPLDPTLFPTEVIPRRHDLAGLIEERDIETVIVAFSRDRDSTLVDPLRECDTLDCEIYVVPRLYEFVHQDRDMDRIHTIPLVLVRRLALRTSHWRVKRITSLITSSVGLLLFSPLLALVAAAIKLQDPRAPVLFRQTRVGQDGHLFTLYKFRTMRPVPDEVADADWSTDRTTRLGSFLRRYSIDELPQLWNVVCGDMSMVGPRPERPHFVDRFRADIPAYKSRHRVHAGLTGWAAIHGLRGDTDIRDRASYDNYYIENWSLWLDTKILLMTAASVLLGRGR
ncbi:Exopolysaccharide biosynthesis polyprenyl glycosylphosphotransferase OS=Tsukamurella paurometabola(strain ATCC 8368 / DSM / CCUG 35730 / CIP 100753 / JCM 10117 / KCTC 9821 / NBRC 16120 / NCIMB 702349 / NCTC 13040)OX=521096 GN=Tpau_2271 PE=3 SV=1 [Tsukamurella paurometabola]|uniref:Exopolysaccharide biosynthesis polyprenyl glycosylphosphotransferase n=1 Tax=Tsukamurella paurometabola (strain ATCC 8368 / DSM 20162 / CCUG 35730 / CIP 100753 / JCM 10117 / KCTC 9821 / NBRC 16120 / NCIMB 702349 / NCTC 13040) TaxID=521096 RepID=D5UQA9_TSUPD|nr:sugar transferase [Tsukamurella paurometabola]ADG78879.1 exopolysaccharide biosynthesis polyprenyl glycosylphosphotransferase [Tsukamurella paurometabola DSM 20162]SUP33403.1 Putative colanic biosynthesis UDP-glucose lipid carrier transferase [Tsukamurella paurometabola]